MKKYLLTLMIALVIAFSFTLTSCGDQNEDFKVGIILVGDETEGYTLAHMDGLKAACKEIGLSESQVIWKRKVEETDECAQAAEELVEAGCKVVFSNSYGHQDYMVSVAKKYKDVQFVSATGDMAAISGASNFSNAFTRVYESRYASGVVAGLKIKELVESNSLQANNFANGKVKVGYVGAFTYAEVVSGYTAFFLGIQSVYANVVMDVQYTFSWFDIDKEAAAAESLIKSGCVIIGQHADSTGAPAKCETLLSQGYTCYSVGYNVDMLSVAPNAALTSATNNWKVFYKDALSQALTKGSIDKDWAKGYSDDAVGITTLGKSCASGTKDAVERAEASLKNGSLKVFDLSKFTVNGEAVANTYTVNLDYMDWANGVAIYVGGNKCPIKTSGSVTYFDESSLRSAPYFSLRIDGITELNPNAN